LAFKIFMIAGEPSGDWLGAKLMGELKKLKSEAEISGIGGPKMQARGLNSLFPIKEISLMGFAEIMPHLPNLLKRIKQTEEEIRAFKPDIVVTIDSPGFVFRVIEKIQDLRPAAKFIHYVAPTVWAYKPKRAKKINMLFDKLLCILPFEPPYFNNAEFIGHPVVEDGLDKGDAAAFKARHNIDDFICMMPGSRPAELKRNLPVFKQVAENMGRPVVIIAADNAAMNIADWKVKTIVVDGSEKADCFAAAGAGVIKSGTSGLEFAFANKPYVVAYRVSWPSYFIIKSMVKIRYANLLNLLAGKELVRELLQGSCTPAKITAALEMAIQHADLSEYRQNLDKLKPPSGAPSANAAKIILGLR
jgi:lipid-A-disaccharide synthase